MVPLQNHWTPFLANNIPIRDQPHWLGNIVNLPNLIFMDCDIFRSHDTWWVTWWLFIFVAVIYDKQKPRYTAIVGCVYHSTQPCCMSTPNGDNGLKHQFGARGNLGNKIVWRYTMLPSLGYFFTGRQHSSYVATFDYKVLLVSTSLRYHCQPIWEHSTWKRIKG